MKNLLALLALSLFLSSCSTYKMEVQQGNALSNETVSLLKPGMSKPEIASLLGTPLLQDNFRKDQWDYVYFKINSPEAVKKQNLTLLFKDGQLIQVKK